MHRFARILRRALVHPAVRSPCILTRIGVGPVRPNLFGVRWNIALYDENIMKFSDKIAQRLRVILASRKNRSKVRALKLNKRTFRRLLVAFTNEDHMKTLPPEILQEVLALAIPDSSRQLMDKVLACFKNFVETVDVRTLSMDPTIHPDQDLLRELADMRLPHEWYGLARRMKRKLIVHCGPTNSGKTYSAIQHLRNSKSGIYCGPLRLLAWEIYERLTAESMPCNLVTGQEMQFSEGARHTACTVEMAELSQPIECAVIDEVQMMGSENRGHAFTRAVLGVPAKTLHLCGDASTVDLVEELGELTGDEVEIKRYTRLGKLEIGSPLTSLADVQKGDCIVAFSRRMIYEIRDKIQELTNFKVCVVYGSLPPKTRQQQAQTFNDPNSGYDILVASDAIGMGLNLNIGRIIFSTLQKFDGRIERFLTVSEVLQIAGRAGRAFSSFNSGIVSCLSTDTFRNNVSFLRDCLGKTPPPLDQIGLYPTFENLETFSKERPHCSFSELLGLFRKYATLDGMYFMSTAIEDHVTMASYLENLKLDLRDLYTMCMAPAGNADLLWVLRCYAEEYVKGDCVRLNVTVNAEPTQSPRQLRSLEGIHNIIELYLWLSNRFPERFLEVEEALRQRAIVQDLIHNGLMSSTERRKVPRRHRIRSESSEPQQIVEDLSV